MAIRSLGAGARRRLHGRAEARRAIAALGPAARRDRRSRPGFPPGVLNVVTGFGEEAGDAAGPPPAGPRRHLHRLGRDRPARHGGGGRAHRSRSCSSSAARTPVLVFADADLDRLVEDVADGAFGNSGQVCSACSQLLVEASDRRRAGRAAARRAPPASPSAPAATTATSARSSPTSSTPRSSATSRRRKRAGARLAARRRPPGRSAARLLRRPDHLRRRRPGARIAREEVFGPVLTIDPLRHRGRGARARQRPRLRPRRRRLHPRHLPRPAPRAAARGRLGLDQRLVHRRPAGADRRHQGQRHRPRARAAGDAQLPVDQECRDQAVDSYAAARGSACPLAQALSPLRRRQLLLCGARHDADRGRFAAPARRAQMQWAAARTRSSAHEPLPSVFGHDQGIEAVTTSPCDGSRPRLAARPRPHHGGDQTVHWEQVWPEPPGQPAWRIGYATYRAGDRRVTRRSSGLRVTRSYH